MDSSLRKRLSILSEIEWDRIERISQECHPQRKPVPMRIYPDDAAFLLEIVERLGRALDQE
jgi:hypothetical protein